MYKRLEGENLQSRHEETNDSELLGNHRQATVQSANENSSEQLTVSFKSSVPYIVCLLVILSVVAIFIMIFLMNNKK